MTTLKVNEARTNPYKLVDDTLANHELMVITDRLCNVLLLAEDDWNAISFCVFYRPQLCENQFWRVVTTA